MPNKEQITVLFLDDNKINSLKGIPVLAQLEYINLRNNNITSLAGMPELAQLRWLYLENNNIDSLEGLSPFVRLTQLQELSLRGNKISEEEKEKIRAHFSGVRVVF